MSRPLRFTFDGEPLTCPDGFTVAGALFLHGRRRLRNTSAHDQPRSLLCGMGVCHECLMQVDGRDSVRACMTAVRDGMQITTQRGHARP